MLKDYIKEEVYEFIDDIYDRATIMKNSKVQNRILTTINKEELDDIIEKVTNKILDIETEEKRIYNLVRDYISNALNEEILKLLKEEEQYMQKVLANCCYCSYYYKSNVCELNINTEEVQETKRCLRFVPII